MWPNISSILGIYGAVVSSALAALRFWEFFRDRVRVEVLFHPYVATTIEGPPRMYSEVGVVNSGRRPVTIDALGVELIDGLKHFTMLCLPQLPITLTESKNVSGFIREGAVQLENVRRAIARTPGGRAYRSARYKHAKAREQT